MKHFSLVRLPFSRGEKWALIDGNGLEFEPFKVMMKAIHRKRYQISTWEAYAGHTARFLDYLVEASNHYIGHTRSDVLDVVDAYQDYLLVGQNSENTIARKIAIEMNKVRVTKPSSLMVIGAAIRIFLLTSEAEARSNNQEALFELAILSRRKVTSRERNTITQNSILGSVIRGGPKFLSNFGHIVHYRANQSNNEFDKKPIPFEFIGDLVSSFKNYRDKAFYALLAASGLRASEALQLRIEDINFETRVLVAINPSKHDLLGLTLKEAQELKWKGRATERVFLIEPFKSMFFKYLEEYWTRERVHGCDHRYIFQISKTTTPLFTASRANRSQCFKRALKLLDLDDLQAYSPHSLRHSYGTYLLNNIPRDSGYGLPLTIVKVFMGHASLKQTERYAKLDYEIAESLIRYANQKIYDLGQDSYSDQAKLDEFINTGNIVAV